MDLDIVASVRDQIIGNCLCVLGDAMAMPVGSMVKNFRDEFEALHRGRARAGRARRAVQQVNRGENAGATRCWSRPSSDAASRDQLRHLLDRRPGGQRARGLDARRRAPSTATSRSPSSATSPSSASRSAPAACAWSRSRASRSSRPRARRRSRTAWSCTRRPTACTTAQQRGRRVPARSTTRSTARSATRAASARCRTSPTAGAPGTLALHRAQAPLQEAARALAAGRHRPRALHPLLPLRALLAGGRRGLPARPARARRALLRRHLRRPPVRRAVLRQHHRAVPGRRADLAAPTASAPARGTSSPPARSARCARRSATSR